MSSLINSIPATRIIVFILCFLLCFFYVFLGGSQPERPPSRSSRQRTDSNSCKDHPTLPPREPRSFRGHQPHRKPPLPTILNPSLQNTTDTLTSYKHELQTACERRGIDSYPNTYQYPSHLQRSTGVYVNTTQGDVYGQGCEVVSSSVV